MADQVGAPLRDPAATSASASAERPTSSTAIFVRMWAVAHLIHLAGATQSSFDTPWNITVAVAALMLLRAPTQGAWLAVLAGAQLVDMVVGLPFSPDHWMLMAAVNLAILATMATRRSWDQAAVAAAFPAARLLLLVGYTAAALSKYNTTFLDAGTSCARAIAEAASFGMTERVDVPWAWVAATIAFETSIPILLAIPATRRHGVRVGMAFHFMLSASPAFAVVDFTAALYALFFLFLSERDLGEIRSRIQSAVRRSSIARHVARAPWVAAAVAFVAFGLLGYVQPRAAAGVLFVFSELYLLGMLTVALLAWNESRETRSFGRVRWFHVPVVVVLVLWAANPYLGLRTTSVFTMFSGLRTEGAAPNHLFMPSFRLTGWQDDFVVIEESNHPEHASARDGLLGIPLIALQRTATDFPELAVSGTMDGAAVDFGPGPGQRQFEPLPSWQYKLFLFRPVAASDQQFCSMS